MEGFEKLVVWQRGIDLVAEVHRISRSGELARDWGLRNQLSRSAVSVPSNVAEGYERGGRKEFARGLTFAKGSCGEVRTQLLIVKRLALVPGPEIDPLIVKAAQLSAMLARLRAAVRKQKDDHSEG